MGERLFLSTSLRAILVTVIYSLIGAILGWLILLTRGLPFEIGTLWQGAILGLVICTVIGMITNKIYLERGILNEVNWSSIIWGSVFRPAKGIILTTACSIGFDKLGLIISGAIFVIWGVNLVTKHKNALK